MGSGPRRRVRSAVVGASLFALAATVPNGVALPPNALVAGISNAAPATHTHTFDVINTTGTVVGSSSWRVVHDTGNCCENYLAATPSGRLLNLGGGEVFFSDDRGVTWKVVRPSSPMLGAEGAIVAAPGGEIAAFTWDPYTGDRMIAYKFEGGRWYYTEGVLHVPFPDRPWISVVPGPISIGGQTVPYLTLMKAGWPSQEVWLQSLDGLNYVRPSTPAIEQQLTTEREYLHVTPDPVLDYTQPAHKALTSPLGGGAALALPAGFGMACGQRILREDGTWSCFELPDGRPLGRTVADSRGWLHDVGVHSQDAVIRYSLSTDGGPFSRRVGTGADPRRSCAAA